MQEQLWATGAALLIGPLSQRLDGEDRILRTHLIAAQLGGLMNALWLTPDRLIRAADQDEVVRNYGRAIQRLLDGTAVSEPSPA